MDSSIPFFPIQNLTGKDILLISEKGSIKIISATKKLSEEFADLSS